LFEKRELIKNIYISKSVGFGARVDGSDVILDSVVYCTLIELSAYMGNKPENKNKRLA